MVCPLLLQESSNGSSNFNGSQNNTGSSKLEVGKVEKYGESKKVTGDGSVDREHNPPKKALKERAREIKGEDLSPTEKRRIDNNSDTVTLPRDVHQKASSSKGYSAEKAKTDAADLQKATQKYSKEHIENSKGTAHADKIKKACEGMNCKTNEEYNNFLREQLDKNQ